MKKLNRTILLAGLSLLMTTAFSYLSPAHGQSQDSAKTVYVCPPCGHNCLKTTFAKPGACGVCGMKLVDKASVIEQQVRHTAKAEKKKVAVLVFPGVQIIDFTGPWEVFGQAGFEVFTVAQESGPITTTFGMSLNPDYNFNDCPKPDFILVPGGNVLKTQSDPQVKTWLRQNTEVARMVLSVCNGAFILAKSGLLTGLKATTTRSLVDGLAVAAPNTEVIRDTRFVDNGKIITSGGLSAGIDAALHLVAKVYGRERAERIATGLEYEWHSDGLVEKVSE